MFTKHSVSCLFSVHDKVPFSRTKFIAIINDSRFDILLSEVIQEVLRLAFPINSLEIYFNTRLIRVWLQFAAKLNDFFLYFSLSKEILLLAIGFLIFHILIFVFPQKVVVIIVIFAFLVFVLDFVPKLQTFLRWLAWLSIRTIIATILIEPATILIVEKLY